MSANTPGQRRVLWTAPFLFWSAAVLAGLIYAIHYETEPGQLRTASDLWPADTVLELDPNRVTLLLFAHPRCPCTRATMGELAILMARCHDRAQAQVVFLQLEPDDPKWARTDLWESAQRVTGVEPYADVAGAEIERFGARVSGETFAYSPDGRLLFHGGITASRGHAGDNVGRSSLESLLQRGDTAVAETPVFGCGLHPKSHRVAL